MKKMKKKKEEEEEEEEDDDGDDEEKEVRFHLPRAQGALNHCSRMRARPKKFNLVFPFHFPFPLTFPIPCGSPSSSQQNERMANHKKIKLRLVSWKADHGRGEIHQFFMFEN